MRVANIMFSRGGGGIEQAFVDYCEGLRDLGHDSLAITVPGASANEHLQRAGITTHSISNFGEWDPIAAWRLRMLLMKLKPDAVIAHANRAFGLSHRAIKGKIPLTGVVHNYRTRRYSAADGVLTITYDLIETLAKQGIPRDRLFHVPNMIRCASTPERAPRRSPPVIGSMGRFVAKKGFDVYIDALILLKNRGVPFKAVLGGTGIEDSALRARAGQLGDQLEFLGWVSDKKAFYTGIDIFCLPSLHEPFGIVLLEAMTHGTPMVTTNCEGPRDIITPGSDALIAEMGSAQQLADALEKLIRDQALAESLAANAFIKVKKTYVPEIVGAEIEKALNQTIANWQQSPAPLALAMTLL